MVKLVRRLPKANYPKTVCGWQTRGDRRTMPGVGAAIASRRDQQILNTLVLRVRVLSLAQVARTWWTETATGIARARRRLQDLERQGLVRLAMLSARPQLGLTDPLAVWQHELPQPDFGTVAHRLRERWKRAGSARRTECVLPEGGVGRVPRVSETTHDLHLAAVYLLMRQECPARARTWTFESELAHRNEKVPDAIVRDGRVTTAIELGGQYSREKLEQFHVYCRRRGMGYEIW